MKRIILSPLRVFGPHTGAWTRMFPALWRATSTRFGVSAYGRSVKEAQQRLFVTVSVEKANRGAFYDGLILGVARNWKHPLDTRPEA